MKQFFSALLAPLLLVLLGLYLLVYQADFIVEQDLFFTYLPYVALICIALVALYFLNYKAFYLALIQLGVYLCIQLSLQTRLSDSNTYLVFVVLNLYWPLVAMMAMVTHDKSPKRFLARITLVMIALLFAIPFFAHTLKPYFDFKALADTWVMQRAYKGSALPLGLLLTYIPALVMALTYLALRPSKISFQWVLLLILVPAMFSEFALPMVSAMTFSVMSVLLVKTVFKGTFHLAFIDELTKIPGRKAMQFQVAGLSGNYVVAMLDVDHFKQFNDTHGHDVGDQVLQMVARQISLVGGGGKAYRYGGEEFTVIFAKGDFSAAIDQLEKVRKSIEKYSIAIRSKDRPKDAELGEKMRIGKAVESEVSVTISIGVALKQAKHNSVEEVLKEADVALYEAKKAGRNCVRF